MTMFISITGVTLKQTQNIQNVTPYVVLADNNGKQLKRTIPKPGLEITWKPEPIFCTDTLESAFFYVYHKQIYRQDQLISIGKFDFSQARVSPYEKIKFNIPTSLQGFDMGTVHIQAQYNQGQIYIGMSSHLQMGSVVHRPKNPMQNMQLDKKDQDKNTSKTSIKITTAISPYYLATGLPQHPDGLIQLQMSDFYPTYNLFSVLDVHQPGTKFRMIQPHIRRDYFN